MNIQDLRNKLEQQKGERAKIEKTLRTLSIGLKEKKHSLIRHREAREIIRIVGLKTQERLQYHISDITSLALDSVFNDPYKLEVEFVQRRNKTECDLYFVKDGNKVDPLEASGLGVVDIATFALRVASWSMDRPHSRNVIILDEPFHFLSEDHQERASIMIKELSRKLNLQFIIVTHEQTLASYADKVFKARKRKGITQLT